VLFQRKRVCEQKKTKREPLKGTPILGLPFPSFPLYQLISIVINRPLAPPLLFASLAGLSMNHKQQQNNERNSNLLLAKQIGTSQEARKPA
jgi:hypothetical protein